MAGPSSSSENGITSSPGMGDTDDSAATLLIVEEEQVSPRGGYVLPILGKRLPEGPVNAAFWLGLTGAAVVGAVELPVAALVGAGVLIARQGRER